MIEHGKKEKENQIIVGQRYKSVKGNRQTAIEEIYGNKVITSHGMMSIEDFSREFRLVKVGNGGVHNG